MRRPRGRLRVPRACRAVLSCAGIVLAAAACGGPAPASAPPSASRPATADPPARSAAPARTPVPAAITVSGAKPVPPNGSQDTSAATPGAACDSSRRAADARIGAETAAGFTLAGFPAAASLLTHFLAGTGTEVDFGAGSAVARQARASSAFQAVNRLVQAEVRRRLQAGAVQVRLAPAQLPTVAFETAGSDLYWGFRGTQGLVVTGSLTREGRRYGGTLRYVIMDSYGFPTGDALAGFGPPMRYLQTTCGAPRHPGGARWFPDTITVTVPFSPPA